MSVCIAVQPESPSNDTSFSKLRPQWVACQLERLQLRSRESSNDASEGVFSVSVCRAVQRESLKDASELRLCSVSVCNAVQRESLK